jgi:hypothetical protein
LILLIIEVGFINKGEKYMCPNRTSPEFACEAERVMYYHLSEEYANSEEGQQDRREGLILSNATSKAMRVASEILGEHGVGRAVIASAHSTRITPETKITIALKDITPEQAEKINLPNKVEVSPELSLPIVYAFSKQV